MPFTEKFLKSGGPEVLMEDENPEPKRTSDADALKQLQALIDALEKGGYDQPKLIQGQPLVVEDLNPVMKVVTYGDPNTYEQWERRCLRMAKVFRFFRIHSWGHMLEQAAYHFESEKERHTIKLQKSRFHQEGSSFYHETKHC